MSLFTEYEYSKCDKRYKSDRHAIKFNCRYQYPVMSFAQFTNRSGLRDIETTLDLCSRDLYRSRLKIMPKSTLTEANDNSLFKHFHQYHAWFVTRAKDNMLNTVTESRELENPVQWKYMILQEYGNDLWAIY